MRAHGKKKHAPKLSMVRPAWFKVNGGGGGEERLHHLCVCMCVCLWEDGSTRLHILIAAGRDSARLEICGKLHLEFVGSFI